MFGFVSSLGISIGQSIWNIVVNIFSFIPKLMYLITTSFFTVLDVFQLLFRKLAGLDTYFVTDAGQTTQKTGDIVEEFILGIFTNKYPTLSNVFWSFIILGIVMLFLTTLIALIRNEYTPEKDGSNSKSKVVGRSFKAFLTFAIVPVVVIFGVYLCNVILRALDSITTGSSSDALGMPSNNLVPYERYDDFAGNDSYIAYSVFGVKIATNTTPFSGVAFKASAYRANRARLSTEFVQLLNTNEITNWNGTFTGTDSETVATYIDAAFANNVKFSEANKLDYGSAYQATNNITGVDFISGSDVALAAIVPFQTLDRYRVGVVWYYYDLWQFDFIVAWAIVLSMLGVFIGIILGLMKRFFEVIGLFLVSPPVVALMPLDDGSAFGKWKGKFVSKILGAYGAVVGMNIMFIILPYIYKIKFFNIAPIDAIIQSIFIIVGLVSVKSFIALMSEISGGDDVHKAGADIAKEVGSTIQKAGAATLKVGGMAMGAPRVDKLLGKGALKLGSAVRSGASKLGFNNRINNIDKKISDLDEQESSLLEEARLEDSRGDYEAGGMSRKKIEEIHQRKAKLKSKKERLERASTVMSDFTNKFKSTASSVGSKVSSFASSVASSRPAKAVGGFAKNIGSKASKGIMKAYGGVSGMFSDMMKGADLYKGWDEAGGGDGMTIYSRGGGASDVKAYKAAKDNWYGKYINSTVDGQGDFVKDANGDLVPERNADGSVKRTLIPVKDENGNIIDYKQGDIIYARGTKKPSAGGWTIK